MIRLIDFFLLIVIRRIYLGAILVGLPIRESLMILTKRNYSKKELKTSGTFLILLLLSLIANYKSINLDIDSIENAYLILSIIAIPFYPTLKLSKKRELAILLFAAAINLLFILIFPPRGVFSFFGIYSFANSTIFSVLYISYAVLSQNKNSGHIILLILGVLIILLDSQRGAYVSLFLCILIYSVKSFRSLLIYVLLVPFILSVFILLAPYFSDRDPAGFFLSILYPERYADSYSSGLHRIMQIKQGIASISESWINFLFGNGPTKQVFDGYFNDIHNGYVSVASVFGVPMALYFLVFLIRKIHKVRLLPASLFGILLISLSLDALTQTTFSSVPTAALMAYSVKQIR